MFDALFVGATGMRGQQTQIDAIAHNLANLNTVGFRRSIVSFAEISQALSGEELAALQASPTLAVRGAGSIAEMTLSSLAGELKPTGEPLDVAIDGLGFLEVTRADGTPAYTRAGRLVVDANGMLALPDGSLVAGEIQIPAGAKEITIAPMAVCRSSPERILRRSKWVGWSSPLSRTPRP